MVSIFNNQLMPGLMITQAWPEVRGEAALTLAAFEKAVALDFFQAHQVVDVPGHETRMAIGSLMQQSGRILTYSLGRRQTIEGLNLASLDKQHRVETVRAVASYFDEALELQAPYVQVLSGLAPELETDRIRALAFLEESMKVLAEAAAQRNLILLIEPLDTAAHKKNALGSTRESVALLEAVGSPVLRLCFDTAHARLNGEDIESVLDIAAPYIEEFHFCNCVIDPEHALYGDHHIPFGAPGWLDTRAMAGIFKKGRAVGMWNASKPLRTFCEIRRPETISHTNIIRQYQTFLESAWERSFD